MRFHRQQYLDLMTGASVPRPMFVELFGTLIGLEGEWRAQGATEDEINLTAFDWDYVPIVDFGGHPLPRGAAPVTLEETDEKRVQRDFLGRTLLLLKKTATHALPMDFPVQNMDDWLRVKPFYTFTPDRINWDEVAAAKHAYENGALIRAYMPGAFDMPRDLMGEEIACLAYYEQPELMADIMATLLDTTRRVLEPIAAAVKIDQLSVHEDFAGKSGPLVGPRQIQEHFRPYYRALWEPLAERGAKIFQMDTDGNIDSVIPALLDCGITCLYRGQGHRGGPDAVRETTPDARRHRQARAPPGQGGDPARTRVQAATLDAGGWRRVRAGPPDPQRHPARELPVLRRSGA